MRTTTPYNEGYSAGYNGTPHTKNPYMTRGGGKDALLWQEGWWAGRDAFKTDLACKRKESAQ